MYVDALSFLEDEREAWAPFETLAGLSDEELERPRPEDGPSHGWAGRDLMAHLSAWQHVALQAARELAVNDASPTIDRVNADWDAIGGDELNARILAEWRALPLEEVRRRFTTTPGEMRGYLTVVPEARWIKSTHRLDTLLGCTLDHYAEHEEELRALVPGAL
ncbi:MAG: hypothetical protein M0Z49_10930 [Chloroflexi bacterium]|nr:hypothetical protein [Chloroflexota bacterium]